MEVPMKQSVLGFVFVLAFIAPAASQLGPRAQDTFAEASGGAIPLFEGKQPHDQEYLNPEQWFGNDATLAVRNVSQPTLKPLLPPPDKASGAGIIVIPGGAFLMLAMGNEGMEIAKALVDHGIAAFVLKYRTEPTPLDEDDFANEMLRMAASLKSKAGAASKIAGEEAALADAQQAIRLVRARAKEWGGRSRATWDSRLFSRCDYRAKCHPCK
jgi:hypothetical protein